MTHKVFSCGQLAYKPINDIYGANMFQYPYSVPGFAVGYKLNEIASDTQHAGVYSYYPNWYHQKKMSHPKRKKSFTIRAILGLKDNSEQDDNNECLPSEILLPPRLSPEPVQMLSSRCFENEEFPHRVESVSSSDSHNMSSDTAICRLSPPCLERQSTNNCRSSQDGLSPNKRTKRNRTMFTPHQLEKLELEFRRTQYIVGGARIQLASELNLTENQVKVWFQNRRIKQRKQIQEVQQAKLAKLKEIQADEKHSDSESDFSNSQISSSCSSSDDSYLQ